MWRRQRLDAVPPPSKRDITYECPQFRFPREPTSSRTNLKFSSCLDIFEQVDVKVRQICTNVSLI